MLSINTSNNLPITSDSFIPTQSQSWSKFAHSLPTISNFQKSFNCTRRVLSPTRKKAQLTDAFAKEPPRTHKIMPVLIINNGVESKLICVAITKTPIVQQNPLVIISLVGNRTVFLYYELCKCAKLVFSCRSGFLPTKLNALQMYAYKACSVRWMVAQLPFNRAYLVGIDAIY